VPSFPDKDWCVEAHGRLVSGDPTAPAQLCKAILAPLAAWLYAKRRTTDKELVRDAATDALVDYIKHPNRWNSERGTLVSYICMAADRDLLNALEKANRRSSREILTADVEEEHFDRNVSLEEEKLSDSSDSLLPALDQKVASERDRQLLVLMLQGERSTNKFAQLLKIEDLPKEEKALRVKQHKDRLKKVIERLRSRTHAR
jgi:RNA polymerase sigma-70 factor (ECF subfamily)